MAVNLVNLESVHKAHGTTVVLDDVSLGVADGERIGVVGRNGGGKSTLLGVVAGVEPVDTGRVTRTGGLTPGRVGPDDELPPDTTLRLAVGGPRAQHGGGGDPRGARVPAGPRSPPAGPAR